MGYLYASIGGAVFDHLGIKDGLSQNSAQCIVQDKRGMIWIGTEDGLNSYDGQKFRVYRRNKSASGKVQNDLFTDMLLTDSNAIWLLTATSVTFFQPEVGFGREYNMESGNRFYCMASFGNGSLFLGSKNGLFCIQPDKRQLIRLLPGWDGKIFSMTALTPSSLLLGTSKGLILYNPLNNSMQMIPGIGDNEPVTAQFKGEDGIVWIGSQLGGIFSYNIRSGQLINYSSQFEPIIENGGKPSVNVILLDWNKQLWIGARNGLYQLDIKTGQTFAYRHNPADGRTISKNDIRSMLVDKNRILWVGSYGGGVNTWSEYKYKFTHHQHNLFDLQSLSDNYILSFAEGKNGTVWVGTDGKGLDQWNRVNNTFTNIPTHSSEIFSIAVDSKGNSLWLGTENGVECVNLGTGKSMMVDTRLPVSVQAEKRYIKVVHMDETGDVYAGGEFGLFKYNKVIKAFESCRLELPDLIIRDIKSIDRNQLVLATNKGLTIWNKTTGRLKHFLYNYGNNNGCRLSSVCLVKQDIWCAGYGVFKVPIAGGKYHVFDVEKGLSNGLCYGVLPDNEGNVWVSSNGGLSKIEINGKITNYTIADGLQSNEFNGGACCKLSSGELLFGGVQGFNIFNPAAIRKNPYSPETYITSVKVMDQPVLNHSQNSRTIYKVPYTRNYFEFSYAAFDFTSPSQNKYTYILEGYDKQWSDSTTEVKVTYHNLPPGTYTFKVNGSNNDGVWGAKANVFTFEITPPFWKTTWFMIAALLLGVTATFYLLQRRIAFLRKRDQLKAKLLEIENKALRSQMNPHFIFNSLNAIQNIMLQGKASEALRYLSKFSKLLRSILNNSEKKLIFLDEEITTLKLYLDIESLRFDHAFQFNIKIDSNVETEEIEIPPLIIQPFVENAIWHGLMHKPGDKVLEIVCGKEHDMLLVVIDDNGVGREKAAEMRQTEQEEHISHATRIIAERMAILYQHDMSQAKKAVQTIDKKDESGKSIGTKVLIRFPLH